MMDFLLKLIHEEEGEDLVEYGLLASFISIVAIAAIQATGPPLNELFRKVLGVLKLVPKLGGWH